MNWIRSMLAFFYKKNKKDAQKLGKDGKVYLLSYPARTVQDDGLISYEAPTETELVNAVFIPFPAHEWRFFDFGEDLNRQLRGQIEVGTELLYVDKKKMYDLGITIDIHFDRIKWDNNQYKILGEGRYQHYEMVACYLLKKVTETFED